MAGFLAKKVPYVPGSGGSKALVVEGMEWKPIWISHAGLCPADDGKCHGSPIEGYAWLVGVGKRAPHGFRCLRLASPHGSLAKLKLSSALFP